MVGPANHVTSENLSTTEDISEMVQMSLIATRSQITTFRAKRPF